GWYAVLLFLGEGVSRVHRVWPVLAISLPLVPKNGVEGQTATGHGVCQHGGEAASDVDQSQDGESRLGYRWEPLRVLRLGDLLHALHSGTGLVSLSAARRCRGWSGDRDGPAASQWMRRPWHGLRRGGS